MLRINLLFATYSVSLLLLVLLRVRSCNGGAANKNLCPPSSCGNIHNISYPFRLKNDPTNCGDHRYTLSCENNNTTVLYLYSGKFYVQAINYDNFTIRLVDPGVVKDDCSSLPLFPLTEWNFSSQDPFTPYKPKWKDESYPTLSQLMIFVDCPFQFPVLNSSLYVDTAPCINNQRDFHSYVNIGGMNSMDLMNSCSLQMMVQLPDKDYSNMPFIEIHRELAFGFEISWHKIYCRGCNDCHFDDRNNVRCLSSDFKSVCYLSLRIQCNDFYSNECNFKNIFRNKRTLRIDAMSTFKKVCYLCVETPCVYLNNSAAYRMFYGITKSTPTVLVLLLLAHTASKIVCGTPLVIAFLIYKWRRRHLSGYDTVEEFLQSYNNLMPVRYSYSDIKKMTEGFKEKLGEGGFGTVYKGKLRSGLFAAIKMLGKSKSNGQDFMNEVATIGRIHHSNVVHLIGFCAEGSKQALIYEFMSNGSLNSYISSREGSISLSWEKLYQISLGVAHGIEYLHQGCEMQILHFDIKPHNILLDENFTPKVSDFGLARLYESNQTIKSLTAARGTIGYMAPELFYRNIGRVSHKSDVYSFGMLLLEMAGKRKKLNVLFEDSSETYFPLWVYDEISDGKEMRNVDATEDKNEVAKKMVIVGLWCIQMRPCDRPPMNKVTQMLEADLESLELPPRPSLCAQEMPISNEAELSIDSVNETESSSLIQNTF